jgi:hypothetical protein
MPVTKPEYCEETAADTVISRFMDMKKFRDLFANEELYFRRVDLFKENDPREGLPDDDLVRRMVGLTKGDVNDEQTLRHHQASTRQFSESSFINCWHLYEGETLKMWDQYGDVAVFSRYDQLKEQLDTLLDNVLLGPVRYGDQAMSRYNTLQVLFTKRAHFEKERELRAVVECYDPVAGMNRHFDTDNNVYREPLDDLNKLHDWVHPFKRRRVDLPRLVTEIRVSPWASEETFKEIQLFASLKKVICSINWSELRNPYTPTKDEFKAQPGK